MRIIPILLFAFFFSLSLNTVSQTITYKADQVSLRTVFSVVERQTGFFVMYNNEQLDNRLINVVADKLSVKAFMDLVLRGLPYGYSVEGKTVFVRRRAGKKEEGEPVKGRVVDYKADPLAGATVRVKGTDNATFTDASGNFALKNVNVGDVLVISYVGFEGKEYRVVNNEMAIVVLERREGRMDTAEVVVVGNTGYQAITRKHPGSFDVVNNTLINRKVSTDILGRIENLTSGVSFRNPIDGLLIRGRNSIVSNVSPLIVLDNFPYEGNVSNINPNDIESITILKDAAAAAQWGARAGNGVIVIASKKGKTGKGQVELNSNVTTQRKENLHKLPIISSSDYVELERWLFDKGYYNNSINNTFTRPAMTPVVETLVKKRASTITEEEANRELQRLSGNNVLNDLENYFYQTPRTLQNALNLSGNSSSVNYYMSIGWDNVLSSYKEGGNNNRITLRSQNAFKINRKLEIEGGVLFTQNDNKSGFNTGILGINSGGGTGLYPYADLVDENGNALPLVKNFRDSYTDTAGNGKLLNWKYKPLDEIGYSDFITASRNMLMNAGVKFQVTPHIRVDAFYRYEYVSNNSSSEQREEAYVVRDLINRFYQPNAVIKFPVPIGGIFSKSSSELNAHQGRLQLNYNRTWEQKHQLTAIAGWEIRDRKTQNSPVAILYGYNKEGNQFNSTMDFSTEFTQYNNPFTRARITNQQGGTLQQLDRFISLYANALYVFDNRYHISGSVRKDAANLFGTGTNGNSVPLWSAGFGWSINNERFYHLSWLPILRLRASYGYSGNYSRQATAVATIKYNSGNTLGLNLPSAFISNPPNKELRWEQNRQLNVGLDFGIRNNRLSGTLEVYQKENKDLMAQGPIDPTSGLTPVNGGVSYFYGNVASTKGHGVDIQLTSLNIDKAFTWQSTFLISYSNIKVSAYYLPPPTTSQEFIGLAGNITPIVGKPLFTMYSYKWAGLDPISGDPLGYVGKVVSNDYSKIQSAPGIDNLEYHGLVQPPLFGAFRNDFTWKGFSLSLNISYKLRYYFRRNSINYNNLYSTWTGHSDYAKRWQKTGDELITNVPSRQYITYPQFFLRDGFYATSSALVEKGDHVRLEDISARYSINKARFRKLPVSQIQVYAYLSNLNLLLWKANNVGIDPNFINGRTTGVGTALGLNIIF